MDRKKTILIAVMINMGFLAVLLITALVTQEETLTPAREIVQASSDPMRTSLIQEEPKESLSALAELALTEEKKVTLELEPQLQAQEPVHKLPPLVKKEEPKVALPEKKTQPLLEVVVKRGDTLEKLAKAHGTTVDVLLQQNHLPSSFLRVGQVLKIPQEKTLKNPPKLKAVEPIAKVKSAEYYVVKVGDNPWTIAMKHHMKVAELLKLNGLNEEKAKKLKPGDRLRIR